MTKIDLLKEKRKSYRWSWQLPLLLGEALPAKILMHAMFQGGASHHANASINGVLLYNYRILGHISHLKTSCD